MKKRTVELSSDVQKLVNYYLEHSDSDFNSLLNKSLKAYIVNELDSKKVTRILKQKDDDSYSINQLLHNSFGWVDER